MALPIIIMIGYAAYQYDQDQTMKKQTNWLIKCTLALCFAFFTLSTFAAITDQSVQLNALSKIKKTTRPPLIIPPPPSINAKAYVLMDANSGTIIAKKNMDGRLPPASLTKLMTLYVISEALSRGQITLDDKVRISEEAWRRGGSRMFVKEGSSVPVKLLIQGIIVASGNDACVAMAQYIAGSESSFAALMNQTAKRLGMTNTHFVDSTGLPKPAHYATPHDLAILARALIQNFPQYYSWYKQKWIKYNGIRQPNRNRLLWRDPSVDGLKTGHTQAAGYCLISSGVRNSMRLISVVMGTPSDADRSNDSQALLNWGFRFYRSHKIFSANTAIAKPRVWFAKHKYASLGVTKDLYVTTPVGQFKNIKASMQLPSKLHAPIIKGQAYGKIQITLKDKPVATTDLVALDDDPKAGLWSRAIDHIELFFKGLF